MVSINWIYAVINDLAAEDDFFCFDCSDATWQTSYFYCCTGFSSEEYAATDNVDETDNAGT